MTESITVARVVLNVGIKISASCFTGTSRKKRQIQGETGRSVPIIIPTYKQIKVPLRSPWNPEEQESLLRDYRSFLLPPQIIPDTKCEEQYAEFVVKIAYYHVNPTPRRFARM